MTTVSLGVEAYNRTYGQEPEIELLNRFVEKNPTNQVEQVTLLARPGDTFFTGMGDGPIRVLDHQPGVFGGDLFYVSGQSLYRYDGTTTTAISGVVQGSGTPSTTFVGGPGYEHLFIADGVALQYYDGEAASSATLTASAGISATETVTVAGVYYEFTAGSVDAGAPDGSLANPWLVALGVDTAAALKNLFDALNLSGLEGTAYSTGTVINALVEAFSSDATTLIVKAKTRGVGGDTIAVAETGVNLSWSNPTLEGGGAQALNGVPTPDNVSIVSLETLASFVIAVVSNSQRFYYLQPGALTIDALDFAEAESEPDELIQVLRVGDSLYFFGQSSTEVWYATGAQDLPFAPQRGLAFSQGVLEGTPVAIRTQVVVIAEDGIVYEVVGGAKVISQNGIEERIRLAQAALP